MVSTKNTMTTLTDQIYRTLDKIGYLHPIHPAMTHMPIGLVVAAFFFGWLSLLPKYKTLMPSAHYVMVLAFIFLFPTVILGLMDWRRYYAGVWMHPIKMKMILACVLFFLLLAGIILGSRTHYASNVLVVIHSLCFMTVVSLGYYGGQLVYGGRAPAGEEQYQVGQTVFDDRCTGCHAHGGNVYRPSMPLRSAPQLEEFEGFLAYLRNPRLPDGSKGMMPSFTRTTISDARARELYEYIVHVIAKPQRR